VEHTVCSLSLSKAAGSESVRGWVGDRQAGRQTGRQTGRQAHATANLTRCRQVWTDPPQTLTSLLARAHEDAAGAGDHRVGAWGGQAERVYVGVRQADRQAALCYRPRCAHPRWCPLWTGCWRAARGGSGRCRWSAQKMSRCACRPCQPCLTCTLASLPPRRSQQWHSDAAGVGWHLRVILSLNMLGQPVTLLFYSHGQVSPPRCPSLAGQAMCWRPLWEWELATTLLAWGTWPNSEAHAAIVFSFALQTGRPSVTAAALAALAPLLEAYAAMLLFPDLPEEN
jgi:hypothetical protein